MQKEFPLSLYQIIQFYACIRQLTWLILQIKNLTNQKTIEEKPQGCEISHSITLVIYLQSGNEEMMNSLLMRINEFHTKYMTPWLKYMEDSQDLWNIFFFFKSERSITHLTTSSGH